MKRETVTLAGLLLAFAAATFAVVVVFWVGPSVANGEGMGGRAVSRAHDRGVWSVAWRTALGAQTEAAPCAWSNGWVVADGSGRIVGVSRQGVVRWRTAYSNEAFAGACDVGGRVALASEGGEVLLLDAETGSELWRRKTDGRFVRAPVAGTRGLDAAFWLISQEDGRLFCLRVADGEILWTGEATNRCDGSPAVQPQFVAYGNCDGAIYVFDVATGALRGKVEVGTEDQMAGGLLSLSDGRVVAGTRSGRLVVVDLARLTCDAAAQISESEAFVTPVALEPHASFAMAVNEGEVTVWDASARTSLKRVATFAVGKTVDALASEGGRLFALESGTLAVFDGKTAVTRIQLGDDAGALGANAFGEVACVADGALVCVREGGV